MTARYRPMRTKIGVLTTITAKYAGQSAIESAGLPVLRVSAAHNASGIMTESMQIAMTRFNGPGISTVCRAKLLVDSTVFDPKMNLPDTHPRLATLSDIGLVAAWIFLSP